ncbi:MAG: hypothetical protein JNK46_06900 [Methylobacteriaceae bacterium]|nr:hypothetical protein [Methylobacteriaceae bacterium]
MKIALRIDARRMRRWHGDVVARLAAAGHRLVWMAADDEPPAPAGAALLAFERAVLRRGRAGACDLVPLDLPRADGPADLTIDFSARSGAAAPCLRVVADGAAGEDALFGAVLAGGAPAVALIDETGATRGQALAALEEARGLDGAIEAIGSRLAMLIEAVIADGRARLIEDAPPAAPGAAAALRFGAQSLARLAGAAIRRRVAFSPHWRVGWRWSEGGDLLDRLSLDGPAWRVLADPGDRFYADPFPVEWGGRTALFVEDFDHRAGKGVIAAIGFGADGPQGAAELALEEPWHLSYPHVFAWRDALWMVPESSAARCVALYRCVDFPLRWERVATLVEGVEAADATLFEHGGRWWMTAVARPPAGGYSDALSIWHAPAPIGPWTAHAANPALIDARVARPAGGVVVRGGRLLRPAQECLRVYGAALSILEITELTEERFAQRLVARIAPGAPRWPGDRLHTWNRAGRLETIDGEVFNPRLPALRRLAAARQAPAG